MIETKTINVPATVREEETTVCDVCGAKAEDGKWDGDQCEYDEVTVRMTHQCTYPDEYWETGVAWDFCPDCFTEKVRPLLETLAKPREVDE